MHGHSSLKRGRPEEGEPKKMGAAVCAREGRPSVGTVIARQTSQPARQRRGGGKEAPGGAWEHGARVPGALRAITEALTSIGGQPPASRFARPANWPRNGGRPEFRWHTHGPISHRPRYLLTILAASVPLLPAWGFQMRGPRGRRALADRRRTVAIYLRLVRVSFVLQSATGWHFQGRVLMRVSRYPQLSSVNSRSRGACEVASSRTPRCRPFLPRRPQMVP